MLLLMYGIILDYVGPFPLRPPYKPVQVVEKRINIAACPFIDEPFLKFIFLRHAEVFDIP